MIFYGKYDDERKQIKHDITEEETKKAIGKQKDNKATVMDNITAGIFKTNIDEWAKHLCKICNDTKSDIQKHGNKEV